MHKYFDLFKSGLRLAVRFCFSGTPKTMIARAGVFSLACGIISGLVAGGALFLPVMLGAAGLGCTLTAGAFVMASTGALSGHSPQVFAKARFQPLIKAAQGMALGGLVCLTGAVAVTEVHNAQKNRSVSATANAAFAPSNTGAAPAAMVAFTPSSATMAAGPRR